MDKKRKRGGQPGNLNALKHGFYAGGMTRDEVKGLARIGEGLMDEINLGAYDRIAVCGPEVMMHAVLTKAVEVGIEKKTEFSLHRYMKCGIGVCGSCCIDPSGLRVCRDGPVIPGNVLLKGEFGHYTRDASGRKKKL